MTDPNETTPPAGTAPATCPECHRWLIHHEMTLAPRALICPPKLVVVLAENEESARVAAHMHGEKLGEAWVYLPDAAGAANLHPNGWGLLLTDSFKKRKDAEEIREALRAVGFKIATPGGQP